MVVAVKIQTDIDKKIKALRAELRSVKDYMSMNNPLQASNAAERAQDLAFDIKNMLREII